MSQFAWPLMDDSTNGVMIPMSGFKCRDPSPFDAIVQAGLMQSQTCDSDMYFNTEMFLYNCFSTCLNQYCAEDRRNPLPPIEALRELVIFLTSTDRYHDSSAMCGEDEPCWHDQVNLLESSGVLMSKTTLPQDANLFPGLNQCIVELAQNHHH